MAAGNNTFRYFSTLGSATAPGRVTDVGTFTFNPSSGDLITVNEGAGGGEDTHLNDGDRVVVEATSLVTRLSLVEHLEA